MQINVGGIGTGVTRIFGIDNWILYKQVVTSTAVNVNINQYRYGYGAQEKDNEIYGNGNAYTAEFWEYDPRIARRWNTDPKIQKAPGWSPYSTFLNSPILFNDPKGDWPPPRWLYDPFAFGDLIASAVKEISGANLIIKTQGDVKSRIQFENNSLTQKGQIYQEEIADGGNLDDISLSYKSEQTKSDINLVADVVDWYGFAISNASAGELATTKVVSEMGEPGGGVLKVATRDVVKNAAYEYATDIVNTVSRSNQPRGASAIYDLKTGITYVGKSGSVKWDDLHPAIKRMFPKNQDKKLRFPIYNCAEVAALNAALNGGADIKNLVMHTVKISKTGIEDFPRCSNCLKTTKKVKVTSDGY